MFKLVVISGPNTGSSYQLSEGISSLGRQEDNSILLPSERVSKRHCHINVHQNDVTVTDDGSFNGTFVNGQLVKSKTIKPGDRVSVGEYVLQLVEVKVTRPAMPLISSNLPQSTPESMGQLGIHQASPDGPPRDLKQKLIWFFNHTFMPVFYGFVMKSEWRNVCLIFFLIFCIGSVILSVSPLLDANRVGIVSEVKSRGSFMARQIAEQNATYFAAGAETKTDVGNSLHADGVRLAVLIDLDSRIIAPNSRLNQYLTSGPEASSAIKARDQFRLGRETGLTFEDESGVVIAIEPVKVLNPAMGKNVVTAMALVSVDSTLSILGAGEVGVIYFQAFIIVSIFGLIIFTILYKVTLRPFLVLNEDLDRALKGELPQVTHEYQLEELNSLWEIINSAIQRIPNRSELGSSVSSIGIGSGERAALPEDFEGPVKMLGTLGKVGVVGFSADRQIIHLNSIFEELSGIRLESALGQSITSVARDQSLGLFTNELLDRAVTGSEGVSDEYEFSGVPYKVLASAFGSSGQSPRFYLMVLERKE